MDDKTAVRLLTALLDELCNDDMLLGIATRMDVRADELQLRGLRSAQWKREQAQAIRDIHENAGKLTEWLVSKMN